jgi:hypothetical protein
LIVFGAEQIQESKIASSYFDKYVFAVNIGAIFAKFAFPYAQSIDKSYYITYIYGASVLLVAILLFIIGLRYYIHVIPYDSVVTKCIPVTINAFQSWYQYHKNIRSTHKKHRTISSNIVNTPGRVSVVDGSMEANEQPSTFLDFAKAENRGKFIDRIVEDVKSLRGAFVVFTLLIPYWLIYNQAR